MKKSVITLIFFFNLLLFFSCNKEQKDFEKAKQANTIESLKEYATNYPDGKYIDNAKELIDSMIWQAVLNKDSLKNYEKFIEEHPKSKFIESAKSKFDKLLWEDVLSTNTISDYETFIEEYPDNKFIDSAKIMIEKLNLK